MSQASLMTKFQQAELSRLMFLGAKTTDQITHSDWSNFVTHTAWYRLVKSAEILQITSLST